MSVPEVAPEWVHVWWWARRKRVPLVLLGFPQQYGYTDPLRMMNQENYNTLKGEWRDVGSPRVKVEDLSQ